MKVTIIKPDGFVSKDGVGYSSLSLSSIASNVWAVHWDSSTSKGELEKTDFSVEEITEFTPYNSALTEWETANTAATAPEVSTEASVREERGHLLDSSDWTVLPDSPLSTTKIAEWKTYRQALRDLPANTTDWSNPTSPTPPSV